MLTALLNGQSPLRTALGQKMEGSWRFTFVTPDAPGQTNYVLTSFSSDGLIVTVANSSTPPIPPVQSLGNQITGGLGEWVRIGDKQFRFTQMQLIFKSGVPGGFQRTRVTLTLNDTLDGAVGTAFAEFLDLAGNIVFGGDGWDPSNSDWEPHRRRFEHWTASIELTWHESAQSPMPHERGGEGTRTALRMNAAQRL